MTEPEIMRHAKDYLDKLDAIIAINAKLEKPGLTEK